MSCSFHGVLAASAGSENSEMPCAGTTALSPTNASPKRLRASDVGVRPSLRRTTPRGGRAITAVALVSGCGTTRTHPRRAAPLAPANPSRVGAGPDSSPCVSGVATGATNLYYGRLAHPVLITDLTVWNAAWESGLVMAGRAGLGELASDRVKRFLGYGGLTTAASLIATWAIIQAGSHSGTTESSTISPGYKLGRLPPEKRRK